MSTATEIFHELAESWESVTPDERSLAIMAWEAEVENLYRVGDDETASDMEDALDELKAGRPERLLRQEAALHAEAREREAQDQRIGHADPDWHDLAARGEIRFVRRNPQPGVGHTPAGDARNLDPPVGSYGRRLLPASDARVQRRPRPTERDGG